MRPNVQRDRKTVAIVRRVSPAIFLLASCSVAIAADNQDHTIHIPEPMVFDLVHGLGVEQGAFEANVLVLFPLNDTSVRPVDWAPEVEHAVRDGVALEFELGFEDSDLHAYKFAAQFTFGQAFDNRYIHGSQVIVEKLDGADILELTGLYLAGIRFDPEWSTLLMLGFRTETGGDAGDHNEALFNFSLFREVGRHMTLGIESDLAVDLDDDSELLVMPQLHFELSDYLEIQLGAGAEFTADDTEFSAGFRFIYTM